MTYRQKKTKKREKQIPKKTEKRQCQCNSGEVLDINDKSDTQMAAIVEA